MQEVNAVTTRSAASLIRRLRLEKGLTQAQLAECILVSAKAVSKWERAAGLPDAAIVPALSRALGVSSEALLSGCVTDNPQDGGNMKRIKFYRCPECGGLMTATGNPELSCCGRRLAPMRVQRESAAHTLTITDIEDEKLLSWQHPMEKGHHLTFIAAVGYDCVHMVRLYPEGAQEHRLPRIPGAKYYTGCSECPDEVFQQP